MGIETCAIIENRLPANKFRMLAGQLTENAQLAVCMREFDAAMRSYSPQVRAELHAEPWQFQETEQWVIEGGWDAGCRGQCKGPFGNLGLYDNLAKLNWYWCGWRVFIEDKQFRKPVYKATRIISNILNLGTASTAIFIPDSGRYDATRVFDELHRTMPEALTFLNDQGCPPAESLEAIANVPREGYCVTQWPDATAANSAKSES